MHVCNHVSEGYKGLYEAIENWDFTLIENLEQHRLLLKRIEAPLRTLDAGQLLPYLNGCLRAQEEEEILQVLLFPY